MNQSTRAWRALFLIAISGAILRVGVAGAVPPPAPASTPAPAADTMLTNRATPSRQYAAAYDSLIQADWLKKQGMIEEAVSLYTEAQSLFRQLAVDYPSWETNVVSFRLKYCAAELARFRTPPPAAAVPEPVARPPLQALSAEPDAVPAAPPPPVDDSKVAEQLRTALQKERGSNLKRALEGYLTVLQVQPWNRDAIKGASRCYLRAGMTNDARALLQRGMNLPNPDAELNLLMAMVYCQDRDFYKAYQLLLVALNEQPANASAHLAMGVALAGLNKLNEARVETQKAIQLDPKLGDAYYNLALISLKLKPSSPAVAREHYLNALRYGSVPDPALNTQLR